MRRLTRCAGAHVYRFEHMWFIDEEVTCSETGDFYRSETSIGELSQATVWEVIKNVQDDFASNETFFVGILQERINDAITDVELRLTSDGKAVWRVTSNEELTDGDCERLKDWIAGQCSDGYGEGLELDPMAEYSDEEEVEVEDDEPDEDGNYTIVAQVDHRLFVRLYYRGFEVKEI